MVEDSDVLQQGRFVDATAARRYVDAQLSRALLTCSGDAWKDAAIVAPALWQRAASWLTLPPEGWLARRAPDELYWEISSAKRLRATKGWAISGLVWSNYELRIDEGLDTIRVTHSGTVREAEPVGLAPYVQPASLIAVRTLQQVALSDLMVHIMTHYQPNLRFMRD